MSRRSGRSPARRGRSRWSWASDRCRTDRVGERPAAPRGARIRDAILERGWSRGAFSQAFESDELDAAALLMPIVGFLPADDERMCSTIEAIARDLTQDGLVLRYRNDPGLNAGGLRGEEGSFVICSFWLTRCLAQLGEVERAEELFDRLAGYANDLGLLSEEVDPGTRELLGNFPQAFSHIGLITAAWEIDRARERLDTADATAVEGPRASGAGRRPRADAPT